MLLWKMTRQELSAVRSSGVHSNSTATPRQGADRAQWEIPSHSDVLLNLNAPSLYLAEDETPPEWHKLRGVKHTMELKLRCTINSVPEPIGSYATPGAKVRSPGAGAGRSNAFDTVVVSEDAEYIPIGNNQGDEPFTLDVTLAGVGGLGLIARVASTSASSDTELPTGPYYLTYNMFGVTTDTDSFDSLEQPVFHPIIDSFRLQSCGGPGALFCMRCSPRGEAVRGRGYSSSYSSDRLRPSCRCCRCEGVPRRRARGSYPLHPASALTAPAEAELKVVADLFFSQLWPFALYVVTMSMRMGIKLSLKTAPDQASSAGQKDRSAIASAADAAAAGPTR